MSVMCNSQNISKQESYIRLKFMSSFYFQCRTNERDRVIYKYTQTIKLFPLKVYMSASSNIFFSIFNVALMSVIV